MKIDVNERGRQALALFNDGCNCAQAVFCAFDDLMGIDRETALRLSSSMGGGMGRLREVCGAVSGMFLVAGVLYGYSDLEDSKAKSAHYKRIRTLAARFNELHPSIVCRDILGAEAQKGGEPAVRDAKYKHERPCYACVEDAARLTAQMIAEDGAFDPEA
ncbi:MAG: C_GCAxxG_C_C family protein [Clostridia bacterium]|nr:C_GCAxxG_C_C family protein [Clostridia bacterium]